MNYLTRKRWNPYLAGALFGVVNVIAVTGADQLLGASGSFENLASMFLQAVGSSLADNAYFKFMMKPEITWQVISILGVIAGAFVAAKLGGDFKVESVPEQWAKTFGPSRPKRWVLAFLGGVILEYGAGLAGGCTSGLAISGAMQLAPGGFVFAAGLFTTGIITAKLLYGKDDEEGGNGNGNG